MALQDILQEIEEQRIKDGDLVTVVYLENTQRPKLVMITGVYEGDQKRTGFTVSPYAKISEFGVTGYKIKRYLDKSKVFRETNIRDQPLAIQKLYGRAALHAFLERGIK